MLTALVAYQTMVNVKNTVMECGTELHDEKPQWGDQIFEDDID